MYSNELQDVSSNQNTLVRIYRGFIDNQRYLFLITICSFTISSTIVYSKTKLEPAILHNADNDIELLNIIRYSNRTLCSKEADRRGNKQRIISLSIFGPKENQLFRDETFTGFIIPLLHEAKTLFPSWTVRLYSDNTTINQLNIKNLFRSTSNIDICNVNQLPLLGNVGEYLPGKVWRFIPALDPMVDFISSRDLDSPLIERERVVVNEFINSSFIFLSLRDYEEHTLPILGGMWTAALYRDRLLFLDAFSILIDKNKVKKYNSVHDQTLLTENVWPNVKNQTLVFDSYTCEQFPEGHWRPFPTQRPAKDCHVGCIKPCCFNSTINYMHKPCPEKCRPKEHPDWLYC